MGEEKIKFSPLHPLNLAYQLQLNEDLKNFLLFVLTFASKIKSIHIHTVATLCKNLEKNKPAIQIIKIVTNEFFI